jgi:hypothetical protein
MLAAERYSVHDVVDERAHAVADDQSRQLHRVLGNLAHDSGRMLPNEVVVMLEAGQDLGEDLGLYNHLSHVD